ncbi:HlyC/CorC family transporter [Hylemonella gracilis]|uniref:HlyC/CorC family transporter n=1 Tax=Hylemonella gracilis TaxID=80880 RepID=A0A4P6UI28_9BURK|nr:hemolysin family protein [Hylemonella gracilis]QBK04603.1 HlyC/CorC family transporter [Hylemonella gracilis]
MDFLLIAFLIVLNGAFAMSEMALASSRRARLLAAAQSGDGGAKKALELMDNPNQFLSTIQIGITSIGVLNGIVGEAAFSDDLAELLQTLGVSAGASGVTATALVVTLITFVTIIFGELVPKRVGQLYPELVARWVSRPMGGLAMGAKPFVKLLSASTQAVLKLLRVPDVARGVTEEEIRHSLEEGVDAGLIEEHEHQMVRNVFRLDDRPLISMMAPRADIAWLDAGLTAAQCLEQLAHSSQTEQDAQQGEQESGSVHSWYPVCRGSLDDVVGQISVGALLALAQDAAHAVDPVERHAQAAVFVPETLSGMELVEQFRARSLRMMFVVDEYGAVQGLLTPADLLEAITGELQSAPVDAWATQRDDGSWLLDGVMPVDELKARFEIRELPDEDRGRYNTVAGLLLAVSGRLLKTGERVSCAGWEFEVVDLDGRRIDKVLATPLPPDAAPEDESQS